MARKSKRKRERQAKKRADQRAQKINNDVSDTASVNGRDGVAFSDSSNGQSDGKIFVPEPPRTFNPDDWEGPDGELGKHIRDETQNTLGGYERQPNFITEHANTEEDAAKGGYANRQIMELVQNGADALSDTGRIGLVRVILTESYLYCADDGDPIDKDGVTALMFSHMSPKRGANKIGRFGLGFKAVLTVTDSPEFISKSGAFRFDRASAKQELSKIMPDAERYPVLRTPKPIDGLQLARSDAHLAKLMSWCTNVVRLPLKDGSVERIQRQIDSFEPEFLLFAQHVKRLDLEDAVRGLRRTFTLNEEGGIFVLSDQENSNRWRLFQRMHKLSSDAKADRRELDNADEVPIWWAAPLDGQHRVGSFWAFFPTKTRSLLSGIINAPWKTNEDRQNLLEGPFNDEVIRSVTKMVADELAELFVADDPAKHLDVLPRRHEEGDQVHTSLLRKELFSLLHGEQIIPDQSGMLRDFEELQYPPVEVTQGATRSKMEPATSKWQSYEKQPVEWVHHSTYIPASRWSTVDRLCDPNGTPPNQGGKGAPRSSFAEWLEALVEDKSGSDAVEASKVAIQTAALIPEDIRRYEDLGKIILTQDSSWASLASDKLFLPGGVNVDESEVAEFTLVHPDLSSDAETVAALKELGVQEISVERQFEAIVKEARWWDDSEWDENGEVFWELSRSVDVDKAKDIIMEDEYGLGLRVFTLSGNWHPFDSVLLPGIVVPADGSLDVDVAVDIEFHSLDMELIESCGASDGPSNISLRDDSQFPIYELKCQDNYRALCYEKLNKTPQRNLLYISIKRNDEGIGPLAVLTQLSDEGKTRYTDAALQLDGTFEKWTMYHLTVWDYPHEKFESPTVWMLREYGMINTSQRIVALSDIIDSPNEYPDALLWVDEHPKADKIRKAFELPKPLSEEDYLKPVGEADPTPLTDEWPGLEKHLSKRQEEMRLVRCEEIVTTAGFPADRRCFARGIDVYLADLDDDGMSELNAVLDALQLGLNTVQVEEILVIPTRAEILKLREEVRSQSSDAERLLKAVGEEQLRKGLPPSLLDYMRSRQGGLSGADVAEAAISTYHTGALKHYKQALAHLDPPAQMAGGDKAVTFVRSLGFSDEWAGDRNRKLDPFEEVMGPYSLPDLHDYQKKIVDKLRQMLSPGPLDPDSRRGMISLPTGSGKTRVAVQGLVDAMREGVLDGGILWVADRDELCEQAVESWRQVWANIGVEARQLRISRMWAGQPPPMPTNELHVVVATIQTLRAKLTSGNQDYDFVKKCNLVVFDEAHRSIAPSYTLALAEIGFTRRQGASEPFLLGLTATPYRGFNEDETRWLTNRYGSNRLDRGAFRSNNANKVIGELQDMTVLARADHKTIEGGRFRLSWSEIQEAMRSPWLPSSVEIRLAKDPDRTQRILDAYQEHVDGDWATLIFATSVEHAQTLSALLNSRGVKARAVSGSTDRTTRRRVVEEFRNGDIMVLVNYGVFREGFDAPKTRAIIVARPVYSPNLYFQMIGRGLRGIKNGGNDRCLILNVQDNIENFERKLAFTELDWLWDGG